MAKVGRPTDYDENLHPRLAYASCSEGVFTDRKLAKILGISKTTLNAWKKEHPEFLTQILRGKDEYSVSEGEHSLKKLVKGFRYTETTKAKAVVEDGTKEEIDPETGEINIVPNLVEKMVVVKTVSKVRPPKQKSVEFLLTNLAPSRWKNQSSLKLSGDEEGGPIKFEDVKDRQELYSMGQKLIEILKNG